MENLDPSEQQQLTVLANRYPTQELIPEAYSGQPVAAVVGPLFAIGPALVHLLLHRGSIWINGSRILDPATPVKTGDRMVIHTPPGGTYTQPVVTPAMILYEDEALLAFNKPPGWFSVANPWDALGNLEVALNHFLLLRDGPRDPIHLVHRLDRDTSGLLVVSKDATLNAKFQELFHEGRVDRTYWAWCAGAIEWEACEVLTGHMRGANGIWQVYPTELIGQPIGPQQRRVKEARTSFRVLRRAPGATLVEAKLHTGRTHQIRLHMAHLGHPVLGDGRYGTVMQIDELPLTHHLRHAARITLPHPCQSEQLDLTAPPPPQWAAVEGALTG